MGCGGSKPDSDDESLAGYQPVHSRFETFKRIRNDRKIKHRSTLSTKDLLDIDDDSPPESLHNDGRKNVRSPERITGGKEGKGEVERFGEKRENDVVRDDDEEEDKEEEKKEKGRKLGFGRELGLEDFPASPSFREYYVASLQNCDDDQSRENDEENDEGKKAGKEGLDSSNSSQGFATRRKIKRRRPRVLVKKSGAVRHLLNVSSCYKPSPVLLPGKEAQ